MTAAPLDKTRSEAQFKDRFLIYWVDPIEDEKPECPEPFCCHQHLPVVTEDGELSFVINSYWPALSKSETIKYPIIYNEQSIIENISGNKWDPEAEI